MNSGMKVIETSLVSENILSASIGSSALLPMVMSGLWVSYGVLIFIQELIKTFELYQKKETEYQDKKLRFWLYFLVRIICLNLAAPCFIMLMGLSMLGVISFAGLPILIHLAPIVLMLYLLWQLFQLWVDKRGDNNKEKLKSLAMSKKILQTIVLTALIIIVIGSLVYLHLSLLTLAIVTLLFITLALSAYLIWINIEKIKQADKSVIFSIAEFVTVLSFMVVGLALIALLSGLLPMVGLQFLFIFITCVMAFYSTVETYRLKACFDDSIFALGAKFWIMLGISILSLCAALAIAALPLFSVISLATAFSIVVALLGIKIFIMFLSPAMVVYKLQQLININLEENSQSNSNAAFKRTQNYSVLFALLYLIFAITLITIGLLACLASVNLTVVVPVFLSVLLLFLATEIRTKALTEKTYAQPDVEKFLISLAVIIVVAALSLMVIETIAPALLIGAAIAAVAAVILHSLIYVGDVYNQKNQSAVNFITKLFPLKKQDGEISFDSFNKGNNNAEQPSNNDNNQLLGTSLSAH